ncbi:MAG TPA: phosphate propanoyltransferase [Bacilli bacterium]
MKLVPLGVSARHIHLSKEHVGVLYGTGYELTVFKPLSQPAQFAAQEVVSIEGPRGKMDKVRVLGPARGQTQLEISRTDCFTLGVNAPLRQSGNIEGTPGIRLIGPAGSITLEQGVIVAARHIHFHTADAARWGIHDQQMLEVKMKGERPLIFGEVLARVSDFFATEMHLDTDEANAAGVKTGDQGEIV